MTELLLFIIAVELALIIKVLQDGLFGDNDDDQKFS